MILRTLVALALLTNSAHGLNQEDYTEELCLDWLEKRKTKFEDLMNEELAVNEGEVDLHVDAAQALYSRLPQTEKFQSELKRFLKINLELDRVSKIEGTEQDQLDFLKDQSIWASRAVHYDCRNERTAVEELYGFNRFYKSYSNGTFVQRKVYSRCAEYENGRLYVKVLDYVQSNRFPIRFHRGARIGIETGEVTVLPSKEDKIKWFLDYARKDLFCTENYGEEFAQENFE